MLKVQIASSLAKDPRDCPGLMKAYIQHRPSTDTDDPCKNMAERKPIKKHIAHAVLALSLIHI